jgi:hypothetical protein
MLRGFTKMPKKSQSNSLSKIKQETSVGSRIFEALYEFILQLLWQN